MKPHPDLFQLLRKKGYSVYEETNPDTSKDTSRMLKVGASRVYFAKVTDNSLDKAFKEIMKQIPKGTPVICESPALRHYVEPGLFIIMTSLIEKIIKRISIHYWNYLMLNITLIFFRNAKSSHGFQGW